MNGSDERTARFERLLRASSLGRPGAHQLSQRTSAADVERVRRTTVASPGPDTPTAALAADADHVSPHSTLDSMVGCVAELTQIRHWLDETAAGSGGCMVLYAATGSGKTQTALLVGALAAERGISVAARQALPRDRSMPLATLAQALLSCDPPSDEFAWLSQPLMGSDLDTRIVAMRESLQRYTAAQPLLIVVDDAHWMDELSALALEQLVPALAGSPLRWLLTINATHPETPTVLERLLRLDANHIGLTGLDDRAVAQLCTKLLTAELDDSVLNVVAAADGNPTLIAQVLAALRDTGHIRILDGIATVVGATAPALLVQILAGVVRGRSDAAQRLIRLAAVLDPPFDLNVLTHVLDATPEQLRGATDEVVAAGLLAKGSRGVAFRHTLIRQAIARTLDQGTALRLRQRAATIQSAEHIATVPVSASADDLAAATPEMTAVPQPTLYRADSSSTSTIEGSAGRSAGVGPAGGLPHQQTSGGPTVLRILLGAQLRRLREAKAISREDAGWEIRASGSKISRMELGRVSFKERDIADLLTLYGVTEPGERDSLLTLARQGNSPGWWQHYSDILPGWFQSYLGLEAAASLIRTYEIQFVPGLLQTPGYARAVIMLNHRDMKIAEVDRRVELRRQRQQILNGPYAPQLWAVIDEAVLRRPTGGIDVMRTQIEALIDVSKQPNVRLQIIPFHAGGHAAAGGPFTLLRFPEPELPDVVYVEQLTSAIYLDKRDDVDQYAMAMERCTIDAEPPSHTPEILEKLLYEVGRPG